MPRIKLYKSVVCNKTDAPLTCKYQDDMNGTVINSSFTVFVIERQAIEIFAGKLEREIE